MADVPHKTEIGTLDGTPDKRLFWSIISDYDLNTGVYELIDNAVDLWQIGGAKKPLNVSITLDANRQLISVKDDAGGIRKEELRLLIAPGGSRNDPNAEIIGIFGVGSKRAAVALGEHIEIKTRHKKQSTYQIDITEDWLESTDWELPHYEIPNISQGTTKIDITKLRKSFSDTSIDELSANLGEIYSWFLNRKLTIELNGTPVKSKKFNKWAFPPSYLPRELSFAIELAGGDIVNAKITGGLIRDRDPESDNYGVYFYCNNRLIEKERKDRDVGYFVSAEAGVPHPDASLCRVIVELNGPAKRMPWNSSKTGINSGHDVFQGLRPSLIQLTSYFSSLSRRLKSDWPGEVYSHSTGSLNRMKVNNFTEKNPLILPPLPRVNKPRFEQLKVLNRKQIEDEPWTLGLVEAMGAMDVIQRQRFDTKNRIALILLDSNFEIALKEFIVHKPNIFPVSVYNDQRIKQLFRNRDNVVAEVAQHVTIPATLITKAKHYYAMRNKLIHERATVGITDSDIKNYREVVGKILKLLFKLKV